MLSTHHYQSIFLKLQGSSSNIFFFFFFFFFFLFVDKVKMPKITKGYNSWSIFQNLLKSKSGHLLIAANPFTKFQGSSSNSFEIFCW